MVSICRNPFTFSLTADSTCPSSVKLPQPVAIIHNPINQLCIIIKNPY
jgi:hypothetical protein